MRSPLPSRLGSLPLSLLALITAACAAPPHADAGSDWWQVGFGTRVTLDGSRSRGSAFEWRQIAGPPVKLEGSKSKIATFQTLPIDKTAVLSEYPGMISFAQTQTLYQFSLTVRGANGKTNSVQVSVTSASSVPGTGGIPMGTDVYVNGGLDHGRGYSWKLDRPAESNSVVLDPFSRTPHFRADIFKGAYRLTEERSGYNDFFLAGRYDDTPKDCGRSDCHPTEAKGWAKTGHARVARHEPACVRCHTVAFDPGAQNGGFDEACPGGRCEGDKVVLGVVHCLACHGPGFRSKANYGEGSCAQCHDAPPKYTKVAEWRQAKMSHLTVGLEPAVQTTQAGCPDCHSSQGFVRWMKGRPQVGQGLGPTYAKPIACPTCHDPHSAERPHQLRAYGEVKTRSGLELKNMGEGALCATCHNAGTPRAEALHARKAPHAPQADLLAMAGAAGGGEPDSCVTCHVQKAHGGGGHTFIAGGQAAAAAKALRTEIEPLLVAARAKLSDRAHKFKTCGGHAGAAVDARTGTLIVVDDGGHDLGDCDRNGRIEGAEKSFLVPDDALAADAYDFFLIERDKSFGAHNPTVARETLKRLAK